MRPMAFSNLPSLTHRLQQRGNKGMFYLKVTFPKEIQPKYKAAYGKASEMIRLQTDSRSQAEARKVAALAEVQQKVADLLEVANATSADRVAAIVDVLDRWRRRDDECDADHALRAMRGGTRSWQARHSGLQNREDDLSGRTVPLDPIDAMESFGRRSGRSGEWRSRYEELGLWADPKREAEEWRKWQVSLIRDDWRDRIEQMARASRLPLDWRARDLCPRAPHGGHPTEVDFELFELAVRLDDPNYTTLYKLIRREWLQRTRSRLAAFQPRNVATATPTEATSHAPSSNVPPPPSADLVGLVPDAAKPATAHIDGFMMSKRNLAESSKKGYRKSFARVVVYCGDKPIYSYTTLDMELFYQKLKAERSDKKNDGGTLHHWTIYRTISNVRQFFKWAKRRHLIHDDPSRDLIVDDDDDDGDDAGYDPYTTDELKMIFGEAFANLPAFKQWFALVGAFSGMRRGEIEQHEVTDFNDLNGRPHFVVTKESKFGHKKHFKTGASALRQIPLHPTLIRLGFLDWIEKRKREAEDGRLFPRTRYGRWWNEQYTRQLGVWVKRKKVFHSLRGNFRDALIAAAKGDREAVDRIMGHHPKGTGAQYYGSRDLRPHESRLITKVRLPLPEPRLAET
jgi:integrase